MYEYTFTRRQVSEAPITASGAPALVEATKSTFWGAETELLVVAALDMKNHLMGYEVAYKGNVSNVLIRLGELFRLPVRVNASGMIIMHNHPSGSTLPSPDDIYLAEETVKAGALLDIPCLDSIIVNGDGWTHESMRDEHRLTFGKNR
jgi:DNA repair protein RadC